MAVAGVSDGHNGYRLEMDPHVNFITLAVADVETSRRFYVEGLGWEPALEAPGVVMIRLSPTLVLSLWSEAEFEEEVGAIRRGPGAAPFTLAHNVASPDLVDRVLEDAVAAGAPLSGPARHREWGGYSGYFSDPDGTRWEVAHNPGPLGVDLMVEQDKLE